MSETGEFWERFWTRRRNGGASAEAEAKVEPAADDSAAPEPDSPRPFGPGMAWLALRAEPPEVVAEALRLLDPAPAGWRHGLTEAAKGNAAVFITPPVGGWTLAVHRLQLLPDPDYAGRAYTDWLARLSEEFCEVQSYASDRESGIQLWASALGGTATRLMAWLPEAERGPFLLTGSMTAAEAALGLPDMLTGSSAEVNAARDAAEDALLDDFDEADEDDPRLWQPEPETVFEMAGALSLDPTALGPQSGGLGLGLLGRLPLGG